MPPEQIDIDHVHMAAHGRRSSFGIAALQGHQDFGVLRAVVLPAIFAEGFALQFNPGVTVANDAQNVVQRNIGGNAFQSAFTALKKQLSGR